MYAKEEQERDILNMNTNMISGNNSEDDFMGSSFMKGINKTLTEERWGYGNQCQKQETCQGTCLT